MLKMRASVFTIWLSGILAVLPLSFAKADQVGRASWYAMHSRTASGEIMNPNALTAASRTLPFGTHVLVRNLTNGRSVVVRINDRGPFTGGRILDVSKAAAAALGMIGSGTAMVRISTTGRASGNRSGGLFHRGGAMGTFANAGSFRRNQVTAMRGKSRYRRRDVEDVSYSRTSQHLGVFANGMQKPYHQVHHVAVRHGRTHYARRHVTTASRQVPAKRREAFYEVHGRTHHSKRVVLARN